MENIKANNYENAGKRKSLLKVCFIALFAALIAGGTFIAIPIGPVPIVLQNLFIVLAGLILGPFMGAASVALYLLAGLLGAPVFAGFTSGIIRFAGPTGGYLIGYLLAALVTGLIVGKPGINASLTRIILAVAAGFLIVYVPGLLWLYHITEMPLNSLFISGFALFLPGDILKGIAAVLIAKRARITAADFLYG